MMSASITGGIGNTGDGMADAIELAKFAVAALEAKDGQEGMNFLQRAMQSLQ